ncbi:hypothetical protein K6L44_09945 [Gluconacetobacter entanii]|uniref:hypothetical protein n=1 Tax=Gluconacetobacter entanii TaxID=108528 RepID=UPI001C93361A|nr:hypothetical protein [Gluconacetobacter entanii]MBY4640301.1 hypothetical protein [Gluconacetobacter entanii]MCW4579925.1 hypothetical protein [Gluconacetobacter entanii]MCW4584638.1 hypothetical protein [Gluconacetobacter entanii]MCW4588100.1 hypothetical protein [Gluconacetobacter entanii]
MSYITWIARAFVAAVKGAIFMVIRRDAENTQKAADMKATVKAAQETATTETAMASAAVNAPTTDAALDARLRGGTA